MCILSARSCYCLGVAACSGFDVIKSERVKTCSFIVRHHSASTSLPQCHLRISIMSSGDNSVQELVSYISNLVLREVASRGGFNGHHDLPTDYGFTHHQHHHPQCRCASCRASYGRSATDLVLPRLQLTPLPTTAPSNDKPKSKPSDAEGTVHAFHGLVMNPG